MRKFFSYLSLIIPMTLFFASAFWYFFSPTLHKVNASVSPIPDFLLVSENNQVKLLDFWSPMIRSVKGSSDGVVELTAQSVLMYDLSTDEVLYKREPDERLPMASLTKIMTAIVAIENQRGDDHYTVTEANLVGENSMGLTAGEVLTMEELLYGLMLPSGNDAAEVLASNYPKGREAFVKAMNDRAKAMGLTDTRFSNPSGLQGDGEQYTTAHDLLVMTRYALENYELFSTVVSTAEHDIMPNETHTGYHLVNETNLLTTYEGVKGVKTGYTPESGLCLVTYIEYEGHKIIGVILNSQDRRGEMKELLDYSLKEVGITPPPYQEPVLYW